MSAYELIFGEPCGATKFSTGELVFFKMAATMEEPAKTDSRQEPGIFLNYYQDPDGRFSGQYLVCPLSDFAGKNLHHRVGAAHFNLRVHRTEVVRKPALTDDPIYPLRRKYWIANYTVEGLERSKDPTTADFKETLQPEVDTEDANGFSVVYEEEPSEELRDRF